MKRIVFLGVIILAGFALFASLFSFEPAAAQVLSVSGQIEGVSAANFETTGFTYQGQLLDNGSPVSGICDFLFGLWSDSGASSQVGALQTVSNVSVNDGLFTAVVNSGGEFGVDAFDGGTRWLGVSVRCPAGSGGYTALSPAQSITPVPYAFYAAKASNPANVIIVAKANGDFTSIQSAIDSISDATVDNPYLVYVAPGVYTETITMQAHVDVEGSGQDLTRIFSNEPAPQLVQMADMSSLRHVTVEYNKSSSALIGIRVSSGVATIEHATIVVTGTNSRTGGISIDIGGDVTLKDLDISTSGIEKSYGVFIRTGNVSVQDVSVRVSSRDTLAYGFDIRDDSMVDMLNVDVQIEAGGGGSAGIFLNNRSHTNLVNVQSTAKGGIDNAGIYLVGASVDVRESFLFGDLSAGGTTGRGIYAIGSSDSFTITVNSSQLVGATEVFKGGNIYTIFIANSLLDGGIVNANGGTAICAGVYDEAYTFSANICP